MIPIEKLKAVKTIVVHGNSCPDGLASACILNDALPGREIRFIDYGTAEHRDLAATDGMLFCDFSPPAARVVEFVAAGAIVLNHHKTARGIVEAFGPLGVFADEDTEPGVSGAVLAYREVWSQMWSSLASVDITVRWFAELAGVRDTWQTTHRDWALACDQAEALRFWPRSRWLKARPDEWHVLSEIGEVLLEKNEELVRKTIAEAYRFTTPKGTRVVTFQGTHTSDVAEALGADADLVVGFKYWAEDGQPRVAYSLRSRGEFNVADLAKTFGGGGHTKAAGFTITVGDDDPDPFARVRAFVGAYELAKAGGGA